MLLSGGRPSFVPVDSPDGSMPGECFFNVRAAVASAGDRAAYGWAIWVWPGVMVEAEHHAVWELPGGALVDITPKADRETRILFLRDDAATFDYTGPARRQNLRLALSSSPAVLEYVAASDALAAFLAQPDQIMTEEGRAVVGRARQALRAVYDLVLAPSDACTCGSGRQVRKCCGIDRARRPILGARRGYLGFGQRSLPARISGFDENTGVGH